MPLKSFYIAIIVRVVLLLATMTGLALIFGRTDLFFNQIIIGILLIIQVVGLIRLVNRTNRELSRLLLSIKNSDFTIHFPAYEKDASFRELYAAFREIIASYKTIKTEREVQYQYLQLIVSHIRAGVISLSGETISLMNQPALELLGTDTYHYWHNLRLKHPRFVQEVDQLQEGESRLIDIAVNGEHKKLSVHKTTAILLGQPCCIITFQDIGQEVNQSEIDAWHKLIRILTHEIMNSVTPISSLTETLLMMLQEENGEPKRKERLQDDFLPDLTYSLQTIQRRSESLLHFLDDYRKLTRVPAPQMSLFPVKRLFDQLSRLMQAELYKQGISFNLQLNPADLMLQADFSQLEQVLINLLTNSVQALSHTRQPSLLLAAHQQEDGRIVLEVTDNGAGIEEDKLDKIFIPFYSTKENGSGIGLSLSRYIMSLHGGTIRVQSVRGEHTSFFLMFQPLSHAPEIANLPAAM